MFGEDPRACKAHPRCWAPRAAAAGRRPPRRGAAGAHSVVLRAHEVLVEEEHAHGVGVLHEGSDRREEPQVSRGAALVGGCRGCEAHGACTGRDEACVRALARRRGQAGRGSRGEQTCQDELLRIELIAKGVGEEHGLPADCLRLHPPSHRIPARGRAHDDCDGLVLFGASLCSGMRARRVQARRRSCVSRSVASRRAATEARVVSGRPLSARDSLARSCSPNPPFTPHKRALVPKYSRRELPWAQGARPATLQARAPFRSCASVEIVARLDTKGTTSLLWRRSPGSAPSRATPTEEVEEVGSGCWRQRQRLTDPYSESV